MRSALHRLRRFLASLIFGAIFALSVAGCTLDVDEAEGHKAGEAIAEKLDRGTSDDETIPLCESAAADEGFVEDGHRRDMFIHGCKETAVEAPAGFFGRIFDGVFKGVGLTLFYGAICLATPFILLWLMFGFLRSKD